MPCYGAPRYSLVMGINSCEIRAGRLMEIRIEHGFASVADVELMRERISQAFTRIQPRQSVVICADWRRCQLMAVEAADEMGKMIGSFNARIERSAILASTESPTAVLQFMRVVRESQHPDRRLFHRREEAVVWLAECLDAHERARLNEFLS